MGEFYRVPFKILLKLKFKEFLDAIDLALVMTKLQGELIIKIPG